MLNPFGELIERWIAEMIPVVTVLSRPKGLPMAIAASPTWTLLESPRWSGWSFVFEGST